MWLFLACTPPKDGGGAPHSGAPPAHSAEVTLAHSGAPSTTPTAASGDTGASGAETGRSAHSGAGLPTDPEPDFHLVDLNPTSPTYGDTMSPRDELRKVSGWYFTHAS